MTEKTSVPYGLWPSPVTPASLAQSLRLSDVAWDSDGETLGSAVRVFDAS